MARLAVTAALAYTLPAPDDAAPLTSYNAQVATLVLQGLVNRDAPRAFFDTPVFWSGPASQRYFLESFLPTLGFTFTNASGGGLCGLLAAAPPGVVAGVALYDDAALDASRWLAVTAAGLLNLLPVTPAMRGDAGAFPCLAPLPVGADYSRPRETLNVTTNADAVAWGLRHLRPACDGARAYVAGHSFKDAVESVNVGGDPAIAIGLDLAAALRLYVFNLSPDAGAYPAHAAAWRAVVASLAAPGRVPSLYGWAEPEPAMTMSTSLAGGSVLCDGAPNLSFWAALGAGSPVPPPPPPALPYHTTGVALDANTCYVTFQSNEGDTPKIAAALQQGAWLDPRRGSVPIAWGVDPLLLDAAPALLDFYARTATANDTWFSATAGAGYAYPWSMPDMRPYVARAARLVAALTPGWPPASWPVDIWDDNNLTALAAYDAAFVAAGAGGAAAGGVGSFSMQPEGLPAFNGALPGGGAPVLIANKSLWYPQLDAGGKLADLVARVGAACGASVPRPHFALVYGNLADGALNIFDYALAVDSDGGLRQRGVRVVGMQDATALARAAFGSRGAAPRGSDRDQDAS